MSGYDGKTNAANVESKPAGLNAIGTVLAKKIMKKYRESLHGEW